MSELSSKYNPRETEDKWYKYWMDHKFFASKPNPEKEPYTVVIPPPNVTGVLHMGHMLNNTIQDVLVRKARLEGKETCWVPGTDHASIATEAKVVNKLKEDGIDKASLSRDEFMKHAWEWTDKHGGIILEQLKRLGASCDWDRTRFTLEPDLYDAVIDVFIDLYNKGEIYRGVRMINWDPRAKTALSDEEVVYKEVNSKLYYVKYKVEDSSDYVTIATTRPETILGDTAICINPNDERFKHLHGKKAIVPLVDRSVPIILDDYVDMEFGTGCLKVTPAHDLNDYELGIKHNLKTIDILNDDGKLNENAELFIGEDRFKARKLVAKELESLGQLMKVEELKNKVGYSERTDEVIEPKLSLQWFMKMDRMAKPALENVMDDTIKFYPPKFKNSYRHWMENVKDWCISRQLWWGHRIPAWYYGEGPNDFVVAKDIDQARSQASKKENRIINDVWQDEDVLDTWFSSWLWPISVFDGFKNPDNFELEYYYPTNDLVTAPEIMFFWVARMIMAGYEYKGKAPFKNVYYTGIVRDKQGRKMSKSLGNSPDPIELIEKYGADGVRVGMLLCSPAGNDLPFDESLCEQGRNFSNKIWNALRLVTQWDVTSSKEPNPNQTAIDWFRSRLSEAIGSLEESYKEFRISEALMTIYKLIWDDFCSWYLEMVKPDYGNPIDQETYDTTLEFFEKLMKLAHPFMPFITEEIYHHLSDRTEKDCIMVSSYPRAEEVDRKIIEDMKKITEVVSSIRKIRNENSISPKDALKLIIKQSSGTNYETYFDLIRKMGNIEYIDSAYSDSENYKSFIVGIDEFLIPIEVDAEEERARILKEIEYQKGFLQGVEKKLSNEKFVNGAPEQVVNNEKKKKADAESRIKSLEESLQALA